MNPSSPAPAKSNSVTRLIHFLAEKKEPLTSIEIAETLWLAMKMEPDAEFVPAEPASLVEPILPALDSSEQTPDFTTFASGSSAIPPVAKANIALPTPQVGVLPLDALPVWVSDPAMLTNSLEIVRSLKPLLQKVNAGIGQQLDETATVDNIVRTQICLPILQPKKELWFDVILVVDRGSSMHIWQRLVKDISRILQYCSAFRDVRIFDLMIDHSSGAAQNSVRLVSKPQNSEHQAKELIDQRGRRIVIILSDCAGAYWWDGTLLPMLREWGAAMPTVVWQMLPAWMWRRTALGRGSGVTISNDLPGAANRWLQVREQERDELEDFDRRMPVPVVTNEVRDLMRWGWMIAGDRRGVMPGFLLPQQGGAVPRSRSVSFAESQNIEELLREQVQQDRNEESAEVIAARRVRRFLELASPSAQRLMVLLAAAPVITLPVVRLIRDAFLHSDRSPLPVAEVLLSGLLQRLPEQINSKSVDSHTQLDWPDLLQYDFAPGVRNILLQTLPTVETIEVINRVSAEVERRWNQFSHEDFRAFLTNPNAVVPSNLEGLRSFANITADILERLGGNYAEFAEELRYGLVPRISAATENNDFILEDLEYEVAKFVDLPLQDCRYESTIITTILDRFDFETAQIRRRSPLLGLRSEWRIDRRNASAWGYTEILTDETAKEVGLDMIAIPGGSFKMGDESAGIGSQHDVTLQPFYLGRYLITQAQWRVVAGYERIARDLNPNPSWFKKEGNDLPVERIRWGDAQEFCQRLSAKTGKKYRLPSEAEWEYACRAGTTTSFSFGETISPELANYDGTATYNDGPKGKDRQQTTAVGSFPANEWGLHDMHGNLWEWCEDDWHSNYKGAPSDGGAWVEADRSSTYKVLRGGAWGNNPNDCRSAVRGYYYDTNYGVGFRVVCEPPRILLSS